MKTKLTSTFCLMMFLGACTLGCGGDDFSVVSVSGKVTLDGEPVKGVNIAFLPKGDEDNMAPGPFSTGKTDATGAFTLTCRNGEPGAIPGVHRVTFESDDEVSEEAIGEALSEVEEAESEGDQDSIAAATKRYNKLVDKANKANGGIPKKYIDTRDLEFTVPSEGTDAANIELTSD